MTAQELIAALSARYLDTKQMLPDELAHESAAMLIQQAEQIEALKAALKDAATSLDTISRLAGREFYAGEGGERVETYMHHPDQIRGYAKSRHGVAIDAMKGQK